MPQTLQDKIDAHGDTIAMLRNAPTGPYVFPVPSEHTNWRDEQRAWGETAALFDQSFHMTDIAFRGPDVKRLLEENSINNYTALGPLKAFQFTACAASGKIIGDGIGLAHRDGSVSIVGKPTPCEYLAWRVADQSYDVEVIRDRRIVDGGVERRFYRFQLIGPNAYDIFAEAIGAPLPETRFFGVIEFSIDGCTVTALRHSMTGGPGMEFWGPTADRERVLAAILKVGEGHGLRRGGGRAYGSAAPYSGWVGSMMPAIYSGVDMNGFRAWLPAAGFEGTLSLGGSFDAPQIDDYYFDPWDVGYDRFIHWDHDFHGRDALLAARDGRHRRKRWLHWDDDDVTAIFASQYGDGPNAKFLEWPYGQYANSTFDKVLSGDRTVGISMNPVYTVDTRRWFSLAILDPDNAAPGTRLTLIWGEPGGGSAKPTVEPHHQVTIRATVAASPFG